MPHWTGKIYFLRTATDEQKDFLETLLYFRQLILSLLETDSTEKQKDN